MFSDEPTFGTTLARARVGNRIQLFRETWSISKVEEILARKGGVAGIASEIKNEIKRQTRFMSKQIELVLTSNQAAATDTGSAGAKLQGFLASATGYRVNLGATLFTQITESNDASVQSLQTTLLTLYQNGCSTDIRAILPPTVHKVWADTFTGRPNTRVTVDQADASLKTPVNTYIAPVGGIKVEFIPERTLNISGNDVGVLIVDWEQIGIAELEGYQVFERDPNSFANRQGWMDWLCSLWYGNAKAHAAYYNTNSLS